MHRISEKLATHWAIAGGILILPIMFVSTLNAGAFSLDRLVRIFGESVPALPGYEDFVRLMISCAALMFFPYCQYRKGHIAVDLFTEKFPLVLQNFLDKLWLVTLLALIIFLAIQMTFGMIETYQDHSLSPILGWPEWPFYLPGLLSLLFWAGIVAVQLLNSKNNV